MKIGFIGLGAMGRHMAANLQRAGLIKYRRGHLTVVDRKGLEQRTCECYSVVQKEYQRLLPVQALHQDTAASGRSGTVPTMLP